MKVDHYLTPYTKINSKWIKDLNIRPVIIRLLEENVVGKLFDMGLGNNFFNLIFIPKTKVTKEQIDKWDYIKLKSFCTAKKPST